MEDTVSDRSIGKTKINEARFNKDSCIGNIEASDDQAHRKERRIGTERTNETLDWKISRNIEE